MLICSQGKNGKFGTKDLAEMTIYTTFGILYVGGMITSAVVIIGKGKHPSGAVSDTKCAALASLCENHHLPTTQGGGGDV